MDFIENINLWYAKDKNDNIVTIDKINDKNKKEKYYCPICDGEVLARTGDKKIHHFAHIDKSNCTNETMIHFWVKNELLKKDDKFCVVYRNNKKYFTCKNIIIEKSYKTDFGIYRPDITVETKEGEIIFFEIEKSNKKDVESNLDKWICLNSTIIEVNVKDMIYDTKEYKALFAEGKCLKNFDICNHKNQYKKHILEETNIELAKERIKKLNWLWLECKKINTGVSESEDLISVIDCMNQEDRMYVIDGLLKTNCSKFRNLYLSLKQKEIKKYIDYVIECNNINNMSTQICDDTVYRSMFDKNFRIPSVDVFYESEFLFTIHSDYFDKDKIKTKLINIKLIKDYNFRTSVCDKIKNIYKNYNVDICFNGSCNSVDARIYYTNSTVLKEKIMCDDFNNIDNIIINKIKEIRKDIKYCLFENKINDYIEYKNTIINNKLKNIRGNKLIINKNYLSEGVIKINIKLFYDIYDICKVYSNCIYNYENNKIYYFSNIDDFKQIYETILSNKIRKLRYK